MDVNTTNGMGARVLDTIIQQRLCTNGVKEAQKKRRDDGKNIQERLKEARRITSGVLNAMDIANLDHPDLIQFLEDKKMAEDNKLKADVKKKSNNSRNYLPR